MGTRGAGEETGGSTREETPDQELEIPHRRGGQAPVDDGDEGVAVDDSLDPGDAGVSPGARGAGGEGAGSAGVRHGDDLVGLRVPQAQGAGAAGEAEVEVEVELL